MKPGENSTFTKSLGLHDGASSRSAWTPGGSTGCGAGSAFPFLGLCTQDQPTFQRSLRHHTLWRAILTLSFRSFEEVEDTGVYDSMLAERHIMTAAWDQFAFEIRNEPPGASQCRCRVVDDFAVAKEQQRRHMHRT